MSDVIINGMEAEDPREKMAREMDEILHTAARTAAMAVSADDPATAKTMQTAAKTMIEAAVRKLDESVGTKVADETDDDE